MALGSYPGVSSGDYGNKVSRNIGPAPDLLVAVADGLGRTAAFEYQPLSSEGSELCPGAAGARFYSADYDAAADPNHIPFASSMHVVARFEKSNGIGGVNKVCYRYENARVHPEAASDIPGPLEVELA